MKRKEKKKKEREQRKKKETKERYDIGIVWMNKDRNVKPSTMRKKKKQ